MYVDTRISFCLIVKYCTSTIVPYRQKQYTFVDSNIRRVIMPCRVTTSSTHTHVVWTYEYSHVHLHIQMLYCLLVVTVIYWFVNFFKWFLWAFNYHIDFILFVCFCFGFCYSLRFSDVFVFNFNIFLRNNEKIQWTSGKIVLIFFSFEWKLTHFGGKISLIAKWTFIHILPIYKCWV